MDIDKIEYSTKPVTLGDHIWMQRIQKDSADFESMFALITSRTNLSEKEALLLDDEEVSIIANKLADGIITAATLQNLAKGLE